MSERAIGPEAVARARAAVAGVVRHTPVLPSAALSERFGADIALKCESLQRTGSFKVRGAVHKLAVLADAGAGVAGVVCGSAGNHAQALAFAARERGVPCEVFMPAQASIAKIEAAVAYGAHVTLQGESVVDCVAAARERAESSELVFVHPFDDPDVVAGQGTLGLELLDDVPDLATVIVPVGGGGLIAGIAIAVKSARPAVRVVGVRAEVRTALSIADGIAVKEPGALTSGLIDTWVDELVTVTEDEIADAMVLAVERSKLVVEGAGAVGIAALLSGAAAPAAAGTTVVVLSGGNVDAGLLAALARRHETRAGRRLVLRTRVPDRPGALAALLTRMGETGANIVAVEHLREGFDLHVRETGLQIVMETRGPAHARAILETMAGAGYRAEVVDAATPA
jgi:threonine dehydratase